ncbi:SUMF1/EgtB/PvdO family nonheme iron enzyme [uncultured Thiodictyon sp.]|uniref:formylglycine-generating enzyme family protein n=1 Tax=uncultured Thiodictyon sp. TaxID=1846217 RepID=UPI0025F1EBCE|nr:SUMF1/EgtB/PvdO family nonheme iron enzyme [uncultured Thiodictyon sp.]
MRFKASLRVRVGKLVARLGDPRFDPECFYLPRDELLGFVAIPADPQFRIGTRQSAKSRVATIIGHDVSDHEINDARTPTPAFYIARYPVTVAQFGVFVTATGAGPRDLRALRDPDSQPVRYIAWREAMAYCRWLHQSLVGGSALTGCEAARLVHDGAWQVSLPSEPEWEVAARGGQRESVFPWGDTPDPNAANYKDSGIEDTSPVGCFPANGFGLHDMIGNVSEWTRSLWTIDYSQVNDPNLDDLEARDDQARGVRGGSWLGHRGYARCAYRGWSLPEHRSAYLGFRVVLRTSPVS